MRYFECKATLDNELKTRSDEYSEICSDISTVCQEYCDRNEDKYCVCVSNLRCRNCTFIISGNGSDTVLKNECRAVWDSFGISGKIESITEISVEKVIREVRHSRDVDTPEDIEELMNFDELKYMALDEHIVVTDKLPNLADFAEFRGMPELREEAERIDSCPCESFKGHPVHYIFEEDDTESMRRTAYVLVGKLMKANRLESGRTAFMSEKMILKSRGDLISATYANLKGGTIIVSVNTARSDREYADSSEQIIKDVCKCARKYRNDVLTIFHISHNDKLAENTIASYLKDDLTLIRLREALIGRTECACYLSKLAGEKDIHNIGELMDKLDPEVDMYYASELDKIFEDYYTEHLKNELFPAYSSCEKLVAKNVDGDTEGKAAAELAEMIGLSSVKDVINRSVNYYKLQQLYKERDIVVDPPARSMIFTGNPGTAKTTVARLTAKIFRDNGLIESGRLIEVGRADLVGQFVGWTAPMIKKAFKKAKGSILFIDEAYSLVDDRDGSYGDEAINTIVQEMENHRDDTIVIFAGYPDEMEMFLDKNPGLRSRIAFHIDFPDYTESELMDILKLMVRNKNMKLSKNAAVKAQNIFKEIVKQHDFGNGRFVRNLLENATMGMAQRLAKKNMAKLSIRQLTTLEADDFVMPIINTNTEKSIRRIGF